jgi:hypothetical protein
MKKLVLSALAAAALAGSGLAFTALAAPGGEEGPAAEAMADRGFLLDAKLAGMKAALKLTADQEKLWPAFETAVRDADKARMDAMMARRKQMTPGQPPSPIDMLTQMSEHMAQMSQQIKKVADAAKPLYDGLDATQKAHFGPLMRMLRPRGPGGGMMGPMGGMGPMHGPMMMEQNRP